MAGAVRQRDNEPASEFRSGRREVNTIRACPRTLAAPGPSRARVAAARRAAAANGEQVGPHYVVCGADPLAYRLVKELLARRRGAGDRRSSRMRRRAGRPGHRGHPGHPGDPGPTGSTRQRSGRPRSTRPTALALMHQDDVGNLHAALCAQEVNPRRPAGHPDVQHRLAQGVRRLFADCAVLSDAAMAAPAFVAAALGEVAPTHFRLAGPHAVSSPAAPTCCPGDVVCGLAVARRRGEPRRCCPSRRRAGPTWCWPRRPAGPPARSIAARRLRRLRRRRRPFAALLRGLRALRQPQDRHGAADHARAGRRLAGAVLARTDTASASGTSIYFTLLTAITGAPSGPERGAAGAGRAGGADRGRAGADAADHRAGGRRGGQRPAGAHRRPAARSRAQDHIVVVGLGNVGTRVIRQLHDLGVEVVAIDQDPDGARRDGRQAARASR